MVKRLIRQLPFSDSFSLGAIPFFGDSMSYQVNEEQPEPAPHEDKDSNQSAVVVKSLHYENSVTVSAAAAGPTFGRSRSDLNLVPLPGSTSGSSNGYVEPYALKESPRSVGRPAVTKPTRRIRSIPSALPPIPPRPGQDRLLRDDTSDVMDRRAGSEANNQYDISKSIAESAMDISLLTANANQLRLLITYNQGSQTYLACITFIILSLVLQMLVAVTMIIITLTKKNLKETTRQKLKIITSVGVAIITMINILVASLVVAEQAPAAIMMVDAAAAAMVGSTTTTTTTTTAAPTTVGSTTLLE